MSEQALQPEAQVSEVARLPAATEEEAHLVVEQVWRFFCSLRLTLVNLLLLFLGMIAGTFVNPANDSLTNIERAFAGRPGVLWAYRSLELYDLFHSWWFTLLLASLALNLIACSLERLPRIWFLVRFPEKRLDSVKGLRFKAQGPSAVAAEALEGQLRARGFVLERLPDEGDGAVRLFGEKGRYARFGVWVVHLSLLLVLGGGVFGRLTAFEGTADVPQNNGETDAMLVRKPDGSAYRKRLTDEAGNIFNVRCEEFRLKEFEPGRPKAFESDLRLFERQADGSSGRELAHQTITVNHPLRYGGLTFYQASYRPLDQQTRAKVTLVDKVSHASRSLLVGPGEPIDAADGVRYALVGYQDDFAGQGPAVEVVRSEWSPGVPVAKDEGPPGARTTTFWVFSKAPEFDAKNRDDRFALSFEKLTPLYATGLQIAKDPSTPVIYLGCFLLFAGIGIAFYSSHKRVWAKLSAGSLQLGGAAHRNAEVFGEEFEALCGELGLQLPARRAPRAEKAAAAPTAAT
jgi:cytochrome c biogenesis protein